MKYFGISKQGSKSPENEDTFLLPAGEEITGKETFKLEANLEKQGYLFLICDGMGGHQAGEIASRLAVSWFWKDFYSQDEIDDLQEWIKAEIGSINSRLFNLSVEHEIYHGMGTTLVGAIIKEGRAYIFNVGDSRCYLQKGNIIEQLTEDDSEVWQLYCKGLLGKDDLVKNKKSHLITQALALSPSIDIHLYPAIQLYQGDRLILCSDGLHDVLTDKQINDILMNESEIDLRCNRLIDTAIKEGSKDDITVIMVEI